MPGNNLIIYKKEKTHFSIPRDVKDLIFKNSKQGSETVAEVIPRLYAAVLIEAFTKHLPGSYGSNGYKFTKKDKQFVFEVYCLHKTDEHQCGKTFKLSCCAHAAANSEAVLFTVSEQARDCTHNLTPVPRPLSGKFIEKRGFKFFL